MEQTPPTLEQQIELLDIIREKILDKPDSFDMSQWHSDCGTSHCMAGWVQTIKGGGDARDAGDLNLPNFTRFFYFPTDKMREWLDKRAYALSDGDFVESIFGFMSNNLNTYSTLEKAQELDKTNINCYLCHDCMDCKGCVDCMGCHDCMGCERCKRCKRCEDCEGCKGCEDCMGCEGCEDCMRCERCKRCKRCMGLKNVSVNLFKADMSLKK